MIQLMEGDCLKLMATIPAGSVDMILCDLPYGTTNNGWDLLLPLDELWREYHRVIKMGGAVVLFSQAPFSFKLGCSNLAEFRYQWIWRKNIPTGFLNAKRAPLKCHEDILVFCDRGPPYNPQVSYHPPVKASYSGPSDNYGEYEGAESISTRSYPRDILEIDRDVGYHPTQKPVKLCEYLIRTYTDPGMVVLDNCMGSGSSGVACVQCERDFIGIEKDPEYFRISSERIGRAEKRTSGQTKLEVFA